MTVAWERVRVRENHSMLLDQVKGSDLSAEESSTIKVAQAAFYPPVYLYGNLNLHGRNSKERSSPRDYSPPVTESPGSFEKSRATVRRLAEERA